MASPVSLPPMRSALIAPFAVAGREIREVASRPGPFIGGLLGTLVGCAALTAGLLWMPSPAAAEPADTFEVEFIPASMIAIGDPESDEAEAEQEPAAESSSQPEAEVPAASVSEDASVPSSEPEPKPEPETTPKPNPDPNPTPSLPPNGQDIDNPFDEAVWSELVADGDPWAAAVMKALRSMRVPAWAGKIASDSPYLFRLRICKDGSVDRVLRKGSTGDASLDSTLEHEITRLDLPAVPSAMAQGMSRRCMVLDYEFAWLSSGVR